MNQNISHFFLGMEDQLQKYAETTSVNPDVNGGNQPPPANPNTIKPDTSKRTWTGWAMDTFVPDSVKQDAINHETDKFFKDPEKAFAENPALKQKAVGAVKQYIKNNPGELLKDPDVLAAGAGIFSLGGILGLSGAGGQQQAQPQQQQQSPGFDFSSLFSQKPKNRPFSSVADSGGMNLNAETIKDGFKTAMEKDKQKVALLSKNQYIKEYIKSLTEK